MNELNIRLEDAGLSLTAKVRAKGGTQVGSTVAMTEPVSGFYTGDFSFAGVPDGEYLVEFLNGTDLVGQGTLNVRANLETNLSRTADDVWEKII